MSYDIAIWKAGMTRARARAAYAALPATRALAATPAIARCYRAIVAKYPELDDTDGTDDDDDDARSPWAARLDVTDRYILAPMSYSRAADVPGDVAALARPFGLAVYDPQTGDFVAPRRARPARAHDPGAILADRLAKPLARHGFRLAPYQLFDGMPVFARRAGIATQEVTFRPLTARNADLWVRIQLDPIAAVLDPIAAGWKRGLFASGWHGGAIANDLYALHIATIGQPPSLIGDHDISPAGIATTIRQVPRQLARYALPIFDKLATVQQLDAFLHATPYTLPIHAHAGDCERALVGAIVTRLVRRRDRAKWLAVYRPLLSRRSIVPPHQRAARAAFARLGRS